MANGADKKLADTARGQDGIFTIADARQAGLRKAEIRARIDSDDWEFCYDRVYRAAGAPVTWRSELRAAQLAAGPHAAVSHRSAAWIYGLPGGRSDLVELSCPRWRRSRKPSLVVHESTRLIAADMQLVDGIQVSRPERVALELASIYRSADYIERVLHSARRQRLITHSSMHAVFDRMAGRGRPGVTVLREALERWDAHPRATESEMETSLLQMLRRNGLPDPMLQYEVYDHAGCFIGRVDAAYPQWNVVIEYDSEQYHSDEWAIAHDNSRRNRMLETGLVTIVARHADIRRGGAALCRAIRAAARSRAEPASLQPVLPRELTQVRPWLLGGGADGFGFEVFLETEDAVFAAGAGLLVPAEG
jgi:hypothetical protein